ncbi:conserved hypothetical protein [Theileria orientalis strain Shintoku]|uniref:AP2/ERF domain-containing protein n=1 Tax=Theileria orientalis strain Shintoku TaxID=869250 RepID=J4D8X2_THEOR|nr:conserved hypothetical protein [Theileria orientalis strain Shintoku]BAM41060.1 conserved hypothetical protein [Theileria orientalis strain Shintoku]|eukprot:XP_009691361.1 conserved hypothetical protein [Theileria orientalis strain Shintoku]
MGDSKLDSLYNEVPYLINHSGIPGGSVNTSRTTICDSLENGGYDTQNDVTNDSHDGLVAEVPMFGMNYKTQIDFKDPYGPNCINGYNTEYESSVADYQLNAAVNYYSSGLNDYKNHGLTDTSNDAGDDKLNYSSNGDVQHDHGSEYNIHDSTYVKNDDYATSDIKYNYDTYRAGFKGYDPASFYGNPQNLKYQLYNLSQFPNPEVPVEKSTTDKSYNLMNSSYNTSVGLAQNNFNQNQTQNQVIGGYNNFDENLYSYSNLNDSNSISGVKYQRTDNRWIARWTTAEGKRACKSFSVNIYGFNQAKMLAIQARQKGVALSGRSFCNRERQHAMKSGVGIIGIRFDKTQARWVSSYYEGGKRKFRYFTVKDYGYEQAKRNAIIWKSCNDERLVKRVKEGYGLNYGVPDKFHPNMVYQGNYNVNDDNYNPEDNRTVEPYMPSNYVDGYNAFNPDYSNAAYASLSRQQIPENYKSENAHAGFVNPSLRGNYSQEYDPKGSMEFHMNYSYPNTTSSAYKESEAVTKFEDTQGGDMGSSNEFDAKMWSGEMLQCYNQGSGEMMKRYAKDNLAEYGAATRREIDDMTTTTIGSDNHELKSNDSMEYDDDIDDKRRGIEC